MAVHACDPSLVLVGLAGSELIRAGEHYGLQTRQEVFADRGYQADGSLVPRSQPGALIEDEEQALAQTLQMVQSGRVKAKPENGPTSRHRRSVFMVMVSTHSLLPAVCAARLLHAILKLAHKIYHTKQ